MTQKTTYGEINKPARSKINWVTGAGTVVVAAVNASAQAGFIDESIAVGVNQMVAVLIPPVVFILRTFFTVK